ncbi:MAG: DUF4325 domain-containing protein, partial [Actinobacteria bacterium]
MAIRIHTMSVDSEHRLVSIGVIASRLGVSVSWVRKLTDAGLLPSVRTTGGHRRYDPAEVDAAYRRHVVALPPLASGAGTTLYSARSPLAGLEEHVVWRDVMAVLPPSVEEAARGVIGYALTEMVNNAVDHSGGSVAEVVARQRDDVVEIEVRDDGIGVFEHLRVHLQLPDAESSVLELSKGKRTTDPAHHTGQGIFFTSRAVRLFRIEANGISWIVDNERGDQAVGESSVVAGTVVRFSVPLAGVRPMRDLFWEFADEEFEFARSRPSVRLAQTGDHFISRSEAKRLLEGLDRFSDVELDFAGVLEVGQGFADEVVRVWPSTHPRTRLTPMNMSPAVEFMMRRAG